MNLWQHIKKILHTHKFEISLEGTVLTTSGKRRPAVLCRCKCGAEVAYYWSSGNSRVYLDPKWVHFKFRNGKIK